MLTEAVRNARKELELLQDTMNRMPTAKVPELPRTGGGTASRSTLDALRRGLLPELVTELRKVL